MTQRKHNEHSGVTAKQVPSCVFSNDLVTLTVPLSQHTASVSTFEDTEHLRLICLVFCQQVAIRKHAGCSRSSSKKHGKSELHLLPRPKLKTRPTTFLWQPRRRHFTLANQISITNISHLSKKPIRFLHMCEITK